MYPNFAQIFGAVSNTKSSRWIGALLIISISLGLILIFFWSGVVLLLAGIFCLPPVQTAIDFSFQNSISKKYKIRILTGLVLLSMVSYFFVSFQRRPNQIFVATKSQIKKFIRSDDYFLPINNPVDSFVFQVKNYILTNIGNNNYESLDWSTVFIIGDKCWVWHKYMIVNENQN